MKVLITHQGVTTDYTHYLVDGTLNVEDSINVPTLVSFQLANIDNAFVVPKRSSYVQVVSEVYGQNGGYIGGGNPGRLLATGFVTSESERTYLGLSNKVGGATYNGQVYTYNILVTSDEWILNCNAVPYIPAFVNQTDSQILSSIAEALMPGFFTATNLTMASGNLVPYFQYDPAQTWSDIAKGFADANRYHYKVINKTITYQPFGDQPLGIAFDDATQKEGQLAPLDLHTGVLSVPPVNDCIVLGAIEPQTNWETYFIGDGFTSNFQLSHQVFQGTTANLLQDDWTEAQFTQGAWTVNDPLGVFHLDDGSGNPAGALNIIQAGSPGVYTPQVDATFIQAQNGIELGGGINLQHGSVIFNDSCNGLIGGLFGTSVFTPGNCLAGFSASGTASIVTASGAGGINIQPVFNGSAVGPVVITKPNHQYVLQTWIGAGTKTRFTRPYTNLTQTRTFGAQNLAAQGSITWIITDVDLGNYVIEQQNPLFGLFPAAPPPVITKYTQENVTLPPFALYCLANGINLNVSINYTDISLPPQGYLTVQSLTGASGGNLPWLPSQLSKPIVYQLGFGQDNQTAQISQQGEAYELSFYTDDIPSVGARIIFQSWAAGQSVARVQDNIAIAQEASISGDSGLRTAILQNLSPQPRTSDECEAAAAAAILDREYPQFQGTYSVKTIPYKFENLLSPSIYGYPMSGRFLYINSPVRAITGQNFFSNSVRVQVVEPKQEVLQVSIDYGPDLYLERLLPSFLERDQNLLTPTQTVKPPNPITLTQVLNAHLPTLDNAHITLMVDSLTGSYIQVDLGAPITGGVGGYGLGGYGVGGYGLGSITASGSGCEVRNVDSGWGIANQGRVGFFTSQVFTLPRTSRDQTWYLRSFSGGIFSRFSKALRVVYPLVPSSPVVISSDAQRIVAGFAGDVRDIYGLELRASGGSVFVLPEDINPVVPVPLFVRSSTISNGQLYYPGTFNTTFFGYYANANQPPYYTVPFVFQEGDIIYINCFQDASFNGFRIANNLTAYTVGLNQSIVTYWEYALPLNSVGSANPNPPPPPVGSAQLFGRPSAFFHLNEVAISPGGLTTVYTVENHTLAIGNTVIIGAGWATIPPVPPGAVPSVGAPICGQFTIIDIPTANSFTIQLQNPTDPWYVYGTGTGAVELNIVTINGTVAQFLGSGDLSLAAGIVLQRPVFAPADLTIDLTQPDLADRLKFLGSQSGFGRVGGLELFFFNLEWDYSAPVNISTFIVPSVSQMRVDPVSQNLVWDVGAGTPNGYRVETIDTTVGATLSKYTVNHPSNPLLVKQSPLPSADWANPRFIKVTPFDAVGDGIPSLIQWPGASASGFPPAGGAGSYYVIHATINQTILADQVLLRVPFERTVTFQPGMAPSQAWIDIPPSASGGSVPPLNTSDMILSLQKFSYTDGSQDVGVEFGCLHFTKGSHLGFFVSGNGAVFFVGDTLKVIAQNVPGNGVGIGLTLAGVIS